MAEISVINNRRIAKNALFLYVRTFFVMVLSLITSRYILRALGETDYGIYNIVGGIVALFSFAMTAMTATTQRFLNFELGKNDLVKVERVFSVSLSCYIILAVIVLILGETIGLWLVNSKLNIPVERMYAAQWVYQLSIFSCCVQILRIPYNASIIANENMSAYAYISIFETVLRLLIAIFLLKASFDRLIGYSILMFASILIINFSYYIYCKWKLSFCRYHTLWDKSLSRQFVAFAGWTTLGCMSNSVANQGVNIILNIFCGVVVNAAKGISAQVQLAINSFILGFTTALNPQIVKSYAVNDMSGLHTLVFRASRFAFYLTLIVCVPLYVYCEKILTLWLGDVPNYTSSFVKIAIIYCLIDSVSNSLSTTISATGKIAWYKTWYSLVWLMNLPLSYLILYFGYDPVFAVSVSAILNGVVLLGRILQLHKLIKLSIYNYIQHVLCNVVLVAIISMFIAVLFYREESGYIYVGISIVLMAIITSLIVYVLGLTKHERTVINAKLCSFLKRS